MPAMNATKLIISVNSGVRCNITMYNFDLVLSLDISA